MPSNLFHKDGSLHALFSQRFDLAVADFDQRKFGNDKETVEGYERRQRSTVWRSGRLTGPNAALLRQQWVPKVMRGNSSSSSVSAAGRASFTRRHQTAWLENLPTRLGYARNQALRSQLTEGQARHLEPANESTPASGNFASVHYARRTGVTRQLVRPA